MMNEFHLSESGTHELQTRWFSARATSSASFDEVKYVDEVKCVDELQN